MKNLVGKRYWLVGASEGLGAALARKLSGQGVELVLSGRNAQTLKDLVETLPNPALALPCDVSSQDSVDDAVAKLGDIDGIVYLAGLYWPINTKDWLTTEATAMADVNFTGAVRILGAIVPQFVDCDQGHIVITGSLGGFRGMPGAIGYSAAKAGLMTLAECMQIDLKDTGLTVQMVNPGYIRTRLTDKNTGSMPFIMEPDEAAEIMFKHMRSDKFSISFPTLFALFFRFLPLLPNWLYYRIF
ncbi:MAG: SDR family NAD(P)-dependent oxidoreductase [Paracoccaceae bacterium]|nr:SDR family NAD(P)-dependent oxidoreductase [Paracoccaceae bacterium]